jgi:photosystem II stability/assembly factor-like uncharacterized protein/predicted esterase
MVSLRRTALLIVLGASAWACVGPAVRPDGGPSTDGPITDGGSLDATAGGFDATVCDPSAEPCDEIGLTRCAAAGVQTCAAPPTCPQVWSAPQACPGASSCLDERCQTMAGQPGSFHALTVDTGTTARAYFLHVPPDYTFHHAWPLVFDFHGNSTDPAPEEELGLAEEVALADGERFILVRPRSLPGTPSWNVSDRDEDFAFTMKLLDAIATDYRIDFSRIYAFGYANGANAIGQLMGASRHPHLFSGYAFLGGGMWVDPGELFTPSPRIYVATGYRDYLYGSVRDLQAKLDALMVPAEQRLTRQDDSAHDLYPARYAEAWAWLDRGVRPALGTLTATHGWTRRDFPSSSEPLTRIVRSGSSLDVFATSAQGAIWLLPGGTGAWTQAVTFLDAPALSAICILPTGEGVAAGETFVASTSNGGGRWAPVNSIPEFGGTFFSHSYILAMTCAKPHRFIGGGYYTGVVSDNGGDSWSGARIRTFTSTPAQLADLRIRSSSTSTAVIAAGFGYLGRSSDATNFTQLNLPPTVDARWLYAIAGGAHGNWWVVGDHGTILVSNDDGMTWSDRSVPAPDLYAVDFRNASSGLAVGAHGAALWTGDGGRTWLDVSTGLDQYLGGVLWLGDHQAIAVGEGGTVLEFDR